MCWNVRIIWRQYYRQSPVTILILHTLIRTEKWMVETWNLVYMWFSDSTKLIVRIIFSCLTHYIIGLINIQTKHIYTNCLFSVILYSTYSVFSLGGCSSITNSILLLCNHNKIKFNKHGKTIYNPLLPYPLLTTFILL